MGIPLVFQGEKMKLFLKVFAVFWPIYILAFSAQAIETEFSGYLRGGSGLNLEGGQQECFYNAGLPGNFLRLGNECGFYSELGMAFHHVKATSADPFFFQTLLRLVMTSKGTRQYEAQSTSRDISQIEAYVKAGGFDEVPGEYWIGKRFYRELDLNIFDWYYYGDINGVGAGVENIKMGPGKFSFAHLIQANDDVTTTTTVGKPVLNVLDFRYREVEVAPKSAMHFWAAYGWAPASKTATEDFTRTDGYALGTRLHSKLEVAENELALLYGFGAMKDLNLTGSSAVPTNTNRQNTAWNARLVEDWHRDVTDRVGIQFGLAWNEGRNGDANNNKVQWQMIGVRPTYYVTDRFQLVLEGGYSHYKDESELVGAAGSDPVGDRELGRITFAPQLSLKKSIMGRPVMRAFVTHSFWNKGNQASVGKNAPTFVDKLEGTGFGYQFETWF